VASVQVGAEHDAAQPHAAHQQLQPLFSWSKLDRKILAIALPCIVNFAINPLIGAIDLYWVGRMNNALAVAGQAAANQVFNSAFWLVSVLPSVTATLVSEVYATGNRQKVKETVGQSFFLSALIGIPFTLYLLSKPGKCRRIEGKLSYKACLTWKKAW
jgi:Na+-driven multidrug efflux pump